MKYRIRLNRSYYDYDSVRTRHTPKGDVAAVMYVDLDLKSARLSNDRINFHDFHVFNKVLRNVDAVKAPTWLSTSKEDTLKILKENLNFGGASTDHLYWWSIEEVEQ